MKDSRWDDILWSIDSAVKHFRLAVEIFDEGDLGRRTRRAERAEMAFMHAMQSGYTSLEAAITRTMTVLGEDLPTGSDWHKQLVERAAKERPGVRPPIVSADMLPLTRHVRAFRHWATHGYDEPFDPSEAEKAASAARRLIEIMRPAFEAFGDAVDP